MIAAIALTAALVPAATAAAATWAPVTGPLGSSIHQAGSVRGPDGTLHVVWTRDTPGAATNDVLHASIGPTGVVSSVTAIATGFASASNPAIVNVPGGGLEAFFGGIQCTSSTCPIGLFESGSSDGGTSWSTPSLVLGPGQDDQAYASDVNAATLPDGTPFQTWWHTTGTSVHRGLSATSPNYDFQGAMNAGCCGYYSNLAADGSGQLQLAWDSNATGFVGTWSRAVDPATGAPAGPPLLMPGSVTSYNGSPSQSQMLSRTPIAALPGAAGQFVVAYPAGYPTTTSVLLWRVGSASSSTVISEPGDHGEVSLAADQSGRVWTFWTHDSGAGEQVFARRLGAGGYEPVIDLGAPPGTASIYAIDGSVAPNGDPEVLALAGFAGNTFATYYARGAQAARLPAPVLGRSFTAARVSGTVLVKVPGGPAGGHGFLALGAAQVLPAGTSVDARAGSIELTAATGRAGRTQSGVFGGGVFRLAQGARGRTAGLTTLSLLEGAFPGAPSYAACGVHGATAAHGAAATGGRAARLSPKVLQTLHARENHGRFRTRTRASSATVRGTVWDTIDKCGGTVTRVRRGTVAVVNLRTRRTFVVHAGHSYYAKLRP